MTLRHAVARIAVLALLAGCATATSPLKDLGGGAYALTERSTLLSLRSDNLKTNVELKALAFCKERGKALTVYDTRVIDPDPPDFASATVQFRCVAP